MRTIFCAELVAAIAGRWLASTMPKQIGQMLTFAFANRLLAAAEEPSTAQRRRRAHHHRQHQGRAARH
jgi:ribosomal protein S7